MAGNAFFIMLIWAMVILAVYGIAQNNAGDIISEESHGEVTWMLFGLYLGQTVQFVYYFTMPILLFLIACALLKDK